MNVLVDTHTLFWWLTDPSQVSGPATRALEGARNTIYVSPISIWELAIKTHAGKLNAQPFLECVDECLEAAGFDVLAIANRHAVRAGMLPLIHRDPFDRMLIALAQAENIAIVGKDKVFDKYRIHRIW